MNRSQKLSLSTWFLPLGILLLAGGVSHCASLLTGMSVWNLSLPVCFALVRWWGWRVLPSAMVSSIIFTGVSHGFSLPSSATVLIETVTVILSLAIPRLMYGDVCLLSSLRRMINYILSGIALPLIFYSASVQAVESFSAGESVSAGALHAWFMFWNGIQSAFALTFPLLLAGGFLVRAGRISRIVTSCGIPERTYSTASRIVFFLMFLFIAVFPFVFQIDRQWWIFGIFQFIAAVGYGLLAGSLAVSWSSFIILFLSPLIVKTGAAPGIERWGLVNLSLLSAVAVITGRAVDDLRLELFRRREAEKKMLMSEEKFSAAFRNSPVLIAITDIETGEYIDVNDAFLFSTGYAKAELIGRCSSELDIFAKEGERDKIISELSGTGTIRNRDVEIETRNGEILFGSFTADIISFSDGNYLLTTMTDLTERKKMEDSLRSHLIEKEVLIKEIHHRVKNNLQIMIGMLSMHIKKTEGANKVVFERAAERMRSLALVHDKLYYSKNFTEINFNEYLLSLSRQLCAEHNEDRRSITVSGYELLLSLDQAVPAGVIINEILGNAIRHASPQKYGPIAVIIEHIEGLISISVKDSGEGLPPEYSLEDPGTVGATLISVLAHQLRAITEYRNENGTVWTIFFKMQKPAG